MSPERNADLEHIGMILARVFENLEKIYKDRQSGRSYDPCRDALTIPGPPLRQGEIDGKKQGLGETMARTIHPLDQ